MKVKLASLPLVVWEQVVWRNIGTKKAIEAGGLEALLPAINNLYSSCSICVDACVALFNMITEFMKTSSN
jgi:hypothetical protein